MKKFSKIALGVAGCLFALGLILIVSGGLTGGFRKTVEWVRSGELSFGSVNFGSVLNFTTDIDVNKNYPVYSGSRSHEGIANVGEFTDLEIKIGGGEVEVVYKEVEAVNISYSHVGDIQFYVENNTLVIAETNDFWNGFEGADITLTLPYETSFDTVHVSLGGGVINFEGIDAKKVEFEVGAGKVVLDRIEASGVNLKIGAGQITVNNGSVMDLEVEVGMGSFEYEGSISGELNAECAMGEMVFAIAGSVEEHNYNVECSMGNITLDDRSYSGIASERVIDNNSRSTFNLECSMGNIEVSFEK